MATVPLLSPSGSNIEHGLTHQAHKDANSVEQSTGTGSTGTKAPALLWRSGTCRHAPPVRRKALASARYGLPESPSAAGL